MIVLAFLAITQQTNMYQQKTIYHVMIVSRKNTSILEQATKIYTRNYRTPLSGNWNVKFSEIEVSPQPRSVLSLLRNITEGGSVDGMIFAHSKYTTGIMSQIIMDTIPTIGLRTTKSVASEVRNTLSTSLFVKTFRR